MKYILDVCLALQSTFPSYLPAELRVLNISIVSSLEISDIFYIAQIDSSSTLIILSRKEASSWTEIQDRTWNTAEEDCSTVTSLHVISMGWMSRAHLSIGQTPLPRMRAGKRKLVDLWLLPHLFPCSGIGYDYEKTPAGMCPSWERTSRVKSCSCSLV